jgi:hypothetical protein
MNKAADAALQFLFMLAWGIFGAAMIVAFFFSLDS